MNGISSQRWAIHSPCSSLCNTAVSPAYTIHRNLFRRLNSIVITNSYSSDNDSILMSSFEESYDDQDQFGPHTAAEPAETLAPSAELRELCHLQLTMLVTALEARLAAVEETGVRCAVYRRSPASLPSGQLQLQLVAASDIQEAEAAANHRKDLILGIPEANEQYQEAWIVEQNLIVLPDSGGLVLPLAHNQFLVGLLVVECCSPDANAYSGSLAGSLHPPACAVFSPADMALIKQNGTALGLACALDLRAALERAGHAVRRRQVQGLVRQARKPLSTLRTLGAMLAPRLQEGEPERDMTESIMAQGQRLGDIVSQLQAFLAPSMPTVRIGSGSSSMGNGSGALQQQQQLQEFSVMPSTSSSNDQQQQQSMLSSASFIYTDATSNNNSSSTSTTSSSQSNMTAANFAPTSAATPSTTSSTNSTTNNSTNNNTNVEMLPSPALPSSSIGGDFWTPPALAPPSPKTAGSSIGASTGSSFRNNGNNNSIETSVDQIRGAVPAAVAAPLVATLAPLLNSAQNFASVSGVSFLFTQQKASEEENSVDATAETAAQEKEGYTFSFPETAVPVEPIVLKRMLSQLLDGTIACSARGDAIEFVCEQEGAGIVVATRLIQAIGPGTRTRGGAAAMDSEGGHVFLAEFATLSRLARQAGGWFDVTVEQSTSGSSSIAAGGGRGVENVGATSASPAATLARGGSSLMAAMWLPSVPLDQIKLN